ILQTQRTNHPLVVNVVGELGCRTGPAYRYRRTVVLAIDQRRPDDVVAKATNITGQGDSAFQHRDHPLGIARLSVLVRLAGATWSYKAGGCVDERIGNGNAARRRLLGQIAGGKN